MFDINIFRERYPEFANTDLFPSSRINMFKDDAVIIMSTESRWLDFYDVAQYALVAHYLAVSEVSSSGDATSLFPIKKQDVDDVLIESAVYHVKPTMDNYHSTSYGQTYYRYMRMAFASVVST